MKRWLAHLAIGAYLSVLLFGLVAPRNTSNTVAAGAGFGLLVWAASYLGLLPALDLHPPAHRESTRRNLMMIAAHLAWGTTLGAGAAALQRAGSREKKSESEI